MSKKILGTMTLGLLNKKKKADTADREKSAAAKQPFIKPLDEARQLDQRQRGRLRAAPSQTLLGGDSSKLGG